MPANSWATPPSEITLDYDFKTKNLHCEMNHPTRNVRKHYIRTIYVYLNDQEVDKQILNHQESASKALLDVPIDAKSGDVIRLKAICNDAGSKEVSFTIP